MLILFLLIMSLSQLLFFQSDLEIEPRYPLFGGWKATFIIGYGLPLQDFLFESPDGRRYLNFTFGCPLAETVVDKLTIKVRLVPCLCIHTTIFAVSSAHSSFLFSPRHGKIYLFNSGTFIFQVVLPEGSKDPSAVVPFPVEQHLEVTG